MLLNCRFKFFWIHLGDGFIKNVYLQQLAREIMACFNIQITLFILFLLVSIVIFVYLRLKESWDKGAKEQALERKKFLYSATKKQKNKKKKIRRNNPKKQVAKKRWPKSKMAMIILPPISFLLSFTIIAGFLIPMLIDYKNENIITVNVTNCLLEKVHQYSGFNTYNYYYHMKLENGEEIILNNNIGLFYEDLNESIDKPMFETGLSGEELFNDGNRVIDSAIVTYAKKSREILEFKVAE